MVRRKKVRPLYLWHHLYRLLEACGSSYSKWNDCTIKEFSPHMSYLRLWSSAWYLGMVLWWYDYVLNGPIDTGSCKGAAEEFQMAPEAAGRFWEAPQDMCIVELGVPWHIGSLLCALPWRCCNFAGSGRVGTMPMHSQNAHATSAFIFLYSFTLGSLSPILRMYPRWCNILNFFSANESLQIRHVTLISSSSIYQGIQSLVLSLVIVALES
jgi:hypothetical protein